MNRPTEVQTSAVDEPIAQLVAQIGAELPELLGLVVGFVRKDGNAYVRSTPMPPPMLGHVARILGLKVDRAYIASMQQQAPVTRAPSVNQAVSSALRSAAAPAASSPAPPKSSRQQRRLVKKLAKKIRGGAS